MLEELSKKDSKWRSYAIYLTKDKNTADDLVQDMYLKLSDQQKQINDFFVIITIRNLFYDQQKKKKYEHFYNDMSYLERDNYKFEPNDEELEILEYLKENCNWWEYELLEMSTEHSLRQLEKRYGIHFMQIHKTVKKIKDDVKNKYNG